MTAIKLIRAALRKLGVINPGGHGNAQEEQDALDALNAMLNLWSVDGLKLPSVSSESFDLVAGQNTYTIGTGGDFDTARPINIVSAFVREGTGSDTDHYVKIWSKNHYNTYASKDSTGRPYMMAFEKEFPLAKIYLYPSPDSAEELHLDLLHRLPNFTAITQDLATQIGVPSEYEIPIIFNLALMLEGEYGEQLSSSHHKIAKDSLDTLERQNINDVAESLFDAALSGRILGAQRNINSA